MKVKEEKEFLETINFCRINNRRTKLAFVVTNKNKKKLKVKEKKEKEK